jgi:hypothetical protein
VPLTAALPADWIEESLNETILRGYAP